MGLMFNNSELRAELSMLVSILVLVLHVCVSSCAFIVVFGFTNSIYIYVWVFVYTSTLGFADIKIKQIVSNYLHVAPVLLR